MDNINNLIKEYIGIKEYFKDYHKENLFDVFTIFADEVYELYDVVGDIEYKTESMIEKGFSPIPIIDNIINDNEEKLLNEIADVLLTTARLIKEFKLEEPLEEMMSFKYHRQLLREEKNKNEQHR